MFIVESGTNMIIYELAMNIKEARELFEEGYGYTSRKDIEKAKEQVEDSYYRNQLKIYQFKVKRDDEETFKSL